MTGHEQIRVCGGDLCWGHHEAESPVRPAELSDCL